MISRLNDDERAERGLPITPAPVDTCGSRTSARGSVIRIAQAHVGNAAAGDAAAAKAVCTGALRARTHAHSLTVLAKAASAGALPCTRVRIH